MYQPKLRPHLLIDSSIHEQVVVSGFTYRVIHDFYHAVLTVSWRKFIFFHVFIFLFFNLIFAIFYSILPHEINNSDGRFIDAFFLSVQTMSTVGYGSISPNGDFSNIISSVEITFGTIVNALSTGLIFARFAKPMSKIIFANHAVISCSNNAQSLDIRMANGRKTVLLDVNIEVFLCSLQKDAQDRIYRKIDRLPLIQSNIPIFQITFEVNHIIDKHSPLYHYNMQELLEKHSEIAIKITGLDEGTGQMIYCYHVYNFKQIPENYQFQELHYQNNNNTLFIDMKNFNIIEKIS